MTITSHDLKVAILINSLKEGGLQPLVKQTFLNIFAATAPNTQITFFDPIDAQEYPDLSEGYDAIILSGGTAEINGTDPWVLKMMDFIRKTRKEHPQMKVVGICWGHQAICKALGGTVGFREIGPEMGVTDVRLTSKGKKFFPFAASEGLIAVHEFHRRIVLEPAPSFIALAEDNQCYLSSDNKVFTIQGHPEMVEEIAKKCLERAGVYTRGKTDAEITAVERAMEKPHNGVDIWKRIVMWIYE